MPFHTAVTAAARTRAAAVTMSSPPGRVRSRRAAAWNHMCTRRGTRRPSPRPSGCPQGEEMVRVNHYGPDASPEAGLTVDPEGARRAASET